MPLLPTVLLLMLGALVWLVRAALQKEGRPRQFSIASLLFTTVFVAVYFSIVRWLDLHLRDIPEEMDEPQRLIPVAMTALVFVLISVPFVAYMTEKLQPQPTDRGKLS